MSEGSPFQRGDPASFRGVSAAPLKHDDPQKRTDDRQSISEARFGQTQRIPPEGRRHDKEQAAGCTPMKCAAPELLDERWAQVVEELVNQACIQALIEQLRAQGGGLTTVQKGLTQVLSGAAYRLSKGGFSHRDQVS